MNRSEFQLKVSAGRIGRIIKHALGVKNHDQHKENLKLAEESKKRRPKK